MKEISKEGLLNKNINNKRNSMVSFDSISEKQEESSNSSIKNTKILKTKSSSKNIKNTKNSKTILKQNDIIDINNLSLLTAKRHTANILIASKIIKSIIEYNKEEDIKDRIKIIRQNKKRESHKKRVKYFHLKEYLSNKIIYIFFQHIN